MAFIRKKQLRGQTYYALVESCRENGKVRQRLLASLGSSPDLLAAIAHERSMAEYHTNNCNPNGRHRERWCDTFRLSRRRRWYRQHPWARHSGGYPYAEEQKLREVEWEKHVESERVKADKHLRIAKAIEEFAKRGMSEEQWAAKLNTHLAAEKKAEQERPRLFQQRMAALMQGRGATNV